MPTELEELVTFISHGNTQIRQLAVENLVQYSLSEPAIFKASQLLPVKNLMLLVCDYKNIAKNALTIMINLSTDHEVLEVLNSDYKFLRLLLSRLANPEEHNANEISMLLANLVKHDEFKRILLAKQPELIEKNKAKDNTSTGKMIDQILDIFIKGTNGPKNPEVNFDYLSYLFADLAMLFEGRRHFLTQQNYDQIIPLSKLIVFTSHSSHIRRRGVASTIKNVCFETQFHNTMLDMTENGLGVLPYLLLPLMGSEEYDSEDSEGMLEECQLLPSSKQREPDPEILKTHLESLLLLTTTRECRDQLRKIKLYPIVRELHIATSNEDVRDACDRLVQVLMRDEEGENEKNLLKPQKSLESCIAQSGQDDDDDKLIEV